MAASGFRQSSLVAIADLLPAHFIGGVPRELGDRHAQPLHFHLFLTPECELIGSIVKFLELVLQNFGPYWGRQTIDLRPEIEAQTRPIILVGGMNGGGKTTLMDAIRLALYGARAQCSTRGNLSYSDFLTQSVNSRTAPMEETRVELLFEHIVDDRLVEFRLVRMWTKNPKDGKDILGVLEGGEWPSDLAKIWDEYIENLLPIGISNLFLFDGEQVKELAELETPPTVVVEAIQFLLGLELAERLAIDLEILVNRKRKALADTKNLVSLEEIEEKLRKQTEALAAARQECADLEKQVEQAKVKQEEAYEKFISEGGKIAAESSQLEKQFGDAKANAEATRQTLGEIAADVLPLALISPLLTRAQERGEKEIRARQARVARDILMERDKRLLESIAQLALAPKKIEKIQWLFERENQQIEREAEAGESWLEADSETLAQLRMILNHQLPDRLKLANEQVSNLKKKEEEIISLERQMATAAPPEVYEQLKAAVTQAQDEVASAVTDCEKVKRRCQELETAIAKTKRELEKYSEQNIDRNNADNLINSAAKVQETLKDFKERLTKRKLNKLEDEVTECFRYLLHKSDLVHRVSIDTQSFSLSLFDPEGQPVPKHRLSAGEKQLLAIAFLWGLARVSGRNLPVAIDTPLGRLDSSHRQNLVERYFPSASHQVILLSTDTEIGQVEVERLRKMDAIARKYRLKYDSTQRQTTVEPGYFW